MSKKLKNIKDTIRWQMILLSTRKSLSEFHGKSKSCAKSDVDSKADKPVADFSVSDGV